MTKYKLCFAETSFVQDLFLKHEFGLEFPSNYLSMSTTFMTITDEQAIILKLMFPQVILHPEDYEV